MAYNYDDDDDYNDFIERLKDYLKNDKGIVDFDIFFMDDANPDGPLKPNSKGFKVSYHFEPGMDKPDIKIEGNFDPNKLRDYLKGLNLPDNANFRNLINPNQPKTITAKNLSLIPNQKQELEPYLEVNEYHDYVEIVVEAPGIEYGSVITSLSESKKKLKVSIDTGSGNFIKLIQLPYKSTLENQELEIRNGIISIIIYRESLSKQQ